MDKLQIMADKKLVLVGSLLFCAMVGILLLILYYPESSDFDDEFETWTKEINLQLGNGYEQHTEPPEPISKMAAAAKILENMGAGFLAFLAVICVVVGLTFLTCACCVLR